VLLLLGCFMLGQARTNNPLVPRHLLSDPRVMAPAIALGGGFSAVTGAMFLVATSLQKEYGHSALDVGLVLLPQGLAVAVLSAAAARWTHQVASIRRLLAGLALLAVGQFLYLGSAASGYSDHLLPGTLLVGAGIAVMYPAATLMASAAAGPEQQGTASGLLTTHQQVGSASGLAVVTMLQTAWPSGHGFAAVPGLGACLVVTVLTLAGCAWMLQAHRRPQHATTVGRHKDEPAAVAPTQPRI
jgi:predicted MFS family arabinose efflux permease